MASENIGQGVRRWSYLKNLSSSVRVQATQILDVQIQLTKEKDRLQNLKQESVKTQKQREQEYAKLTKEETQVMNTINSLKRQEKKFRAELDKKKKEVERLNKESERILAEAVRQQKLPWISVYGGTSPDVFSTYNVQGVPTAFLIDRNGDISVPSLKMDALEESVKELI